MPIVLHAIRADEDFQMFKLVDFLKECAVVIIPDDAEENLESVYLASECDGMVISYSVAEKRFTQDLESFKNLPHMIKEIKRPLN